MSHSSESHTQKLAVKGKTIPILYVYTACILALPSLSFCILSFPSRDKTCNVRLM